MLCTCIKDGFDCTSCPLKRAKTECSLYTSSHWVRSSRSFLRCENQSLGRDERPPIKLQFGSCGILVVADAIIRKGTSIGRYTGDIVKKGQQLSTSIHSYKLEFTPTMDIDAARGGTFMRYPNFSCRPNSQYEMWNLGGVNVVSINATATIFPGQEITTSNMDPNFPGVCLCGCTTCKGLISLQATGTLLHTGDTPTPTPSPAPIRPGSALPSLPSPATTATSPAPLISRASCGNFEYDQPTSVGVDVEQWRRWWRGAVLDQSSPNDEQLARDTEWAGHDIGFSNSLALFWQGWPSQWHLSPIVEGDKRFNCAEQYMMYHKARHFGDAHSAELILAETNPKFQKLLGRNIQHFEADVWGKRSIDIVLQGNRLKFQQNPLLRKHLIATGHRIIAEASPHDSIWGIGWRRTQVEAWDPNLWLGDNQLGIILMKVRSELKEEDALGAPRAPPPRARQLTWSPSVTDPYVSPRPVPPWRLIAAATATIPRA